MTAGFRQGRNNGMNFFDRYVANLEAKNDFATRESVSATYSRMKSVLDSRDDGVPRVTGLVVGRVQSGKTRNYIGLILKAADEGWNVVLVLTSSNVSLAKQTRDRLRTDFTGTGMTDRHARELDFLTHRQANPTPTAINDPDGFLYWGVAMKERASLGRVMEWLEQNTDCASSMRLLIIDDEADNASQNTRAVRQGVLTEDEAEELAEYIRLVGSPFEPLANWMEEIREAVFPDESEQSPEGEAYRKLVDYLKTGAATRRRDAILNDAGIRSLLLLGEASDGHGGIVIVANLAREFFRGARGDGFRTARTFCAFLRYVLDVSMERSSINAILCALVQTGVPGATVSPFAKTAYIAYTATPYANVLNERPSSTPLYADFIQSLDSGVGYFGPAAIFGADTRTADSRMNIVRDIPDDERRYVLRPIQELLDVSDGDDLPELFTVETNGALEYTTRDGAGEVVATGTWISLRDAVLWTICAASARRFLRLRRGGDSLDDRWTTLLVNVSHLQDAHAATGQILMRFLEYQARNPEALVQQCRDVWNREVQLFSKEAFDALFKGNPAIEDYPSWRDLEEHVRWFAMRARDASVHVLVVNSADTSAIQRYNQENDALKLADDHMWILCGGNTLSRGLTLRGLVGSYFDRFRPSSAVDTMTQMGRWFGYRRGYELLPRVWMGTNTVGELKKVAFIEEKMHFAIRENFDDEVSPTDESHHQEIYCYGRRLSGRNMAQRIVSQSAGTYGSMLEFRTDETSVHAVLNAVDGFLSGLGKPVDSAVRGYAYPSFRLWEAVPLAFVESLVGRIKPSLPSSSASLLSGFLSEMRDGGQGQVHVVLGEPVENVNTAELHRFSNGVSVRCSRATPRGVFQGVVQFGTLRLHIPYYAMIPARILTELDCELMEKDLALGEHSAICTALRANMAKNGGTVPQALSMLLQCTDPNRLPSSLLTYLETIHGDTSRNLPPTIHHLLEYISDGYRNRSSSAYMRDAHERANQKLPVIQIQCVRAVGDMIPDWGVPLCSISFFWPDHNPDDFYLVSV